MEYGAREEIERFMSAAPCPACNGFRLKPEALAVKINGLHIGQVTDMAIRNARDLYTRRGEGVSIWVVPAEAVTTSDPDAKGAYFESAAGKNYRHAVYYTASEGVPHL